MAGITMRGEDRTDLRFKELDTGVRAQRAEDSEQYSARGEPSHTYSIYSSRPFHRPRRSHLRRYTRDMTVRMAAIALALALRAAVGQTPEQKAIHYLSAEVPRWSRENGCYSCHNNGDGARALYAALQRGYAVPKSALADTTRWLLTPGDWDNNRGDPGFSDKKLARIQFAAGLVEAFDAGAIPDRRVLIDAAQSLVPYQEADGSWLVDAGAVGSPATYGASLATFMAVRTLEKADAARFAKAIAKTNRWFLA